MIVAELKNCDIRAYFIKNNIIGMVQSEILRYFAVQLL